MRKFQMISLALMFALLTFGCGGAKKTTAPKPPVTTIPQTEKETEPVSEPAEDSIRVVKETLVETPAIKVPEETYFVIIGSFRIQANSEHFEQQLRKQGFVPFILRNEAGYYRVAVFSYNDESGARSKIMEIRRSYPEYADVWLLIKQ